jgi:hypothetical protein
MAMVAIRAGREAVPGELDEMAARLSTVRLPRVGVQVWAMLRDHEGRARETPPALDAGWREVRALPVGVQLEALTVGEIVSTPLDGGATS